ncbi:MAG: hypothetical protein JW909_12400 [Planctomycetes bacterium]|nr:hypothetical protein [Planctomycetota bacterium]
MQILVFIAGLAALVSCLQVSYRLDFAAVEKSGLSISPADVVLLAAAAVLAVLVLKRKVAVTRLVPGWAVVSLIAASLAVFLVNPSTPGIKELIQLVEMLLVGYILFRTAVNEGRGESLVSDLLLAAAAVTSIVALYQLLVKGAAPFETGGLLENRNHLAAYLVLTVPWAAGRYLAPGSRVPVGARAGAALLVLSAFLVSANVLISLALLMGVLIAIAGRNSAGLVSGAFGRLSLAAVVLVWIAATSLSPNVWGGLATFRTDVTGTMRPSARAKRLQADIIAVEDKPVFGVGLGRYQYEIGACYPTGCDKPDGMTDNVAAYDLKSDEPGSQALWEVIPVEGGLVLTAAWMILLVSGAVSAFRNGRPEVAASLLAAVPAGLVVPVFARGIGVVLAFLLALSDEKPRPPEPNPA